MNTKTNGYYPRVSMGFAKKTLTIFIAFLRNIITLLTGNVNYPTPSPSLADMTTSVNTLETAVHEALDGGKLATATRNAAYEATLTLTRQLANYVEGNCGGDLVTLLSSGFEAVKAPTPVGTLPPPGNQRLTQTGNSGELMFRFDRVPNTANYSVQLATAPDGPWEDQDLSTSTRVLLSNLTPGQVYWARACANGSSGSGDWGGPATAMSL